MFVDLCALLGDWVGMIGMCGAAVVWCGVVVILSSSGWIGWSVWWAWILCGRIDGLRYLDGVWTLLVVCADVGWV